jgi:phenylacetate-CoA ligase
MYKKRSIELLLMEPRPLQVLRQLRTLRNEQWADPETLLKLQRRRLGAALGAARQTPYYSKTLSSLRDDEILDDISLVPATEKDLVRACETDFVPRTLGPGQLRITRTSGSSGRPVRVYTDQDALDFRIALKYFVELEFGLSLFDLFAEVSISPYRPHSLISSLGVFPKMVLPISHGEETNFRRIRDSKATYMGWYPSVMSLFAQLNESRKFKSVFCGGEMLTPECRKLISDSFSCPVFNQYASMEFSSIAWECPEEHSLHINSTSCIVEILDSKNKPKKSGAGELAITALQNNAMPLLRYRLGDRASWGKECPCGRGLPVLDGLAGRNDDFITLPSGRRISSFSLNILYLETNISGIWHYQIVQEKPDLFLIRIVPTDKGFSEKAKHEMAGRIRRACLGEDIKVEFELVDTIKRDSSGKLRKIVSRVKH